MRSRRPPLPTKSQPSHSNFEKTLENWAFLQFYCAMGWDESVFCTMTFTIINKINSFAHVFYGTAVFPPQELWA